GARYWSLTNKMGAVTTLEVEDGTPFDEDRAGVATQLRPSRERPRSRQSDRRLGMSGVRTSKLLVARPVRQRPIRCTHLDAKRARVAASVAATPDKEQPT